MVQQYFTTTTALYSMTGIMFFLLYDAKNKVIVLSSIPFKLKMYRRVIIGTILMFFMPFLFIFLGG